MMSRWLTLRADTLPIDRIEALLPLHRDLVLYLLGLLRLIDSLDRAGQERRSMPRLDEVGVGAPACIQF